MSDSDDDKPIISLIEKRKALLKNEAKAAAEERAKKKVKEEKAKGEVKKERGTRASSSSSGATQSASKRSIAFYEETKKGLLVQRLLVRWWYAIEWPKKEEIGQPPEGYESLEGFPGVFISTKSDSLGTILDLRNKSNCPNLVNLSAWPSEKLIQTLEQAYEKQMLLLAQHEGEDCALYRMLKAELKEIRRINPKQADSEAAKFTF